MLINKKRLVLIGLVLSLVLVGTACNQQELKDKATKVKIRVINSRLGQGIETAEVKLTGDKVQTKQTDKNGIVNFRVRPQKKYQIMIDKQGYKKFVTNIYTTKQEMMLPFKLEEDPHENVLKITNAQEYIDINDTTVKFLFTTNPGSKVKFYLGTSKDNLEKRKTKSNQTNKGLKISNLTPGKKYYYKLEAKGESGQQVTTEVHSFVKQANTNQWEPVDWAQEAVVYEIFVRSFYDGNGDGIGDFVGLKEKIPYFKELGVDALWLMPFNKSTTYHGYDVVDYYQVDSDYGTLEEFREFAEAAHKNDIKIIMDLVLNHSSAQNKWFQQAAKKKKNKYTDYYVWADYFNNIDQRGPWGQQIWQHADNGQYYQALFWSQMPELNYRNPKVREEAKEIAKFWLDPDQDGDLSDGVDGFRLDAALHIDSDKEVTHNWWQEFNTAVKQKNPQAFLVGENWTDTEEVAKFFADLDASFNFTLADYYVGAAAGYNKDLVKAANKIHQIYRKYSDEYIDATFLRNHDQNRVATELNGQKPKIKLAASLLLTMPGTPFIYYGEEIGQRGAKPDDNIREPFDWYQDAAGPGMTTMSKGGFYHEMNYTKPNDGISLAEQRGTKGSIFEHYKQLIELRKDYPQFFTGQYTTIDTPQRVYGYKVSAADSETNLFVVHNFSGKKRRITSSQAVTELLVNKQYAAGEQIKLGAYDSLVFKASADKLKIKAAEELSKYTTTLQVKVPVSTPEEAEIYLASNLNDLQPADADYKLTKVDDRLYKITVEGLEETTLLYTFTRGSWQTKEDRRESNQYYSLRFHTFTEDKQTKQVTVEHWQDKR